MRYHFIAEHRRQWPVRLMCQVLQVCPGGFYTWRDRPASVRQQRREVLKKEIEAIPQEFKARYGSPCIHEELQARGQRCCVNTVAKLMRPHGIAAKSQRKFRCTTDSRHDRPVADNILDRQFEPVAVNLVDPGDKKHPTLRLGIDARLCVEPAPEVAFETILELTTGHAAVKQTE